MARRELHRHVEINHDERTVAAAEVTSQGPSRTAWASLRAESGHITPGRRASLVNAVLDRPKCRKAHAPNVVFPLGNSETLR
jgi:hypothetical protein